MLKYVFVILRKFAVSPMTILIEWPSSLKTEIETDTEEPIAEESFSEEEEEEVSEDESNL